MHFRDAIQITQFTYRVVGLDYYFRIRPIYKLGYDVKKIWLRSSCGRKSNYLKNAIGTYDYFILFKHKVHSRWRSNDW